MTVPRPLRWATVLAAVVLIGIQFIPASRTNPPEKAVVMASPEVFAVLEKACFDCHSHRTVWPWYSRVAPVSWWLADHVADGRADLNFSEWPVFDGELEELYLRDIEQQLIKGKMPPGSYKIGHPEARLTEEEVARLLAWSRDR